MHLFKPKYRSPSGAYVESTKWAVKFVHNGKQIVKSTSKANKAAALTRAKQIVAATEDKGWEVIRPQLPNARKTKVEELMKLYRDYARLNELGRRTVDLNVATVKRLAREIEVEHVEDLAGKFCHWKGTNPDVKDTTTNAILRAARSVFKADCLEFYARQGVRVGDPFKGEKRVKVQVEPFKGYPRKKVDQLVKAARLDLMKNDAPAYRLFVLSLYAGTRQQEALWAKWDDLGERGIMVTNTEDHRTKAGKARFVPLSAEVVAELEACRDSPHALIVPPDRLYLGAKAKRRGRAVAQRLCEWLRGHGLDVKKPIHELRKICGSLIATDHGLYAAKEMLGHSSVAITEGFYAALLERPVVTIGARKRKSKN